MPKQYLIQNTATLPEYGYNVHDTSFFQRAGELKLISSNSVIVSIPKASGVGPY